MNREQRREAVKQFKQEARRVINPEIEAVLASAAEFFGLPPEWCMTKYVESDDKGKVIDDLKFMVNGIKTGEYEFDKNYNFVKVA